MDSIADLMQTKKPNEPPQLQALKDYVASKHGETITCAVSQLGYTLTVPNAPLASTLRMELPKIKEYCHLDKKLFIRIGYVQ